MRPPPLASVKPAGNAPPVTANVYAGAPPLAVIVWLYAIPCVPAVNGDDGLSVIVGHVPIVTDSLRTPVHPFASVTVTSNDDVPVPEGVPERTPAAESVSPDGTAPEVTAYV